MAWDSGTPNLAIHPSRIHTNPTQTPPKTASSESQDRVMIDEVRRLLGLCLLVYKKKYSQERVYVLGFINLYSCQISSTKSLKISVGEIALNERVC